MLHVGGEQSMSLVAIVTGASRGIGRAIAEKLAADDFSVIVNYANAADDASEVVQAIAAAGGRAKAVKGEFRRGGYTEPFR